jgi:hypothetical protein
VIELDAAEMPTQIRQEVAAGVQDRVVEDGCGRNTCERQITAPAEKTIADHEMDDEIPF